MVTREERLSAENKKIQKISSSIIKVVDTIGAPPERYIISFTYRSYSQSADKKIILTNNNRIQITLPFGFPQIPPVIQPLTSVFHPNVDDENIDIGSYWNEKHSLANLILHIGKMYRGEIYSYESPLNKEAAEWYYNNRKNLPLSSTIPEVNPITKSRKIPQPFKRAFLIVGTIVIGAGSYIAFNDFTTTSNAQVHYQEFTKQVKEHRYQEAKNTAESLLILLDKVIFLRSLDSFSSQLTHFLTSRDLEYGLEGKARFKEEYLPIEKVKKLEGLQPFVENAQNAVQKGDYPRAITSYSKAKQYTLDQNLEEEYIHLQKITTKFHLTQLLYQADQTAEKGELTLAVTAYDQALQYALSHKLTKEADEIKSRSIKFQLKTSLLLAHKRFKEKDWEKAAINYEKLLQLMEKERDYLESSYLDSFSGVKKYLLIAQLADSKQRAESAEFDQKFVKALSLYKRMLALISESDTEKTRAIQALKSTALAKIRNLEIEVIIKEKTNWLVKNYTDIFILNYPPAANSTLKDPKATFLKHIGRSMIFSLSCLESNSGRITRLKVFYKYDRDLEDWEIHSQL